MLEERTGMDGPTGEAHPAARRGTGAATRRRLVAAFAALATAVAGAFGLQLVRLARMAEGIEELGDHQDQMHLALAVEEAVRDAYDRSLRALAAGRVTPRDRDDAVDELVLRLVASVDEPEAKVWVERLVAATEELQARLRDDLAMVAAGDGRGRVADQAWFALVFQIEDSVDRLIAFLRDRSAQQAAEVERLRGESLRLAAVFAVGLPLFAVAIGLYFARALREESDQVSAELQRQQERLVRTEKLASLGRLAAGVAHELNNPLQVMIGYLTLHRGAIHGEVADHLARVEREATRCKEIVDGLLQLSRPAEAAPPERVDLREVSCDVAAAIRVALPGAPDLRVTGVGAALGNAARYRQVIFNLVKNAAEAAGAGGRVDVEVACDRGTARVVVSDTGPGIAPDVRAKLFEPFFTTKSTGVGLGLALARAIAQAHGGDVELEESTRGARFSLRAPRAAEGATT